LTSFGTFNAPGEKLRMALMPAFTTRSTTGCAAAAGTASIAMSRRSRRVTRFRSLMSKMGTPPRDCWPILSGDASNIAAISKPSCRNPG
jgi:hypothetical protein